MTSHVNCVRRTGKEERVSVGRSTYDCLCTNTVAAARPVLDDEWLAKPRIKYRRIGGSQTWP
jgi:hypothetical protein